jgi:hypothetical protein
MTPNKLVTEMNIDLNKIDDAWLSMLDAMFADCSHLAEKTCLAEEYFKISKAIHQTMITRSLSRVSVDTNINNFKSSFGSGRILMRIPFGLSSEKLTDEEVRVLYALGAEVADFSFLGNGVRNYVEAVWIHFREELDRRKIDAEFFCDLEI